MKILEDFGIKLTIIIAQIINFTIVAFILQKYFIQPIYNIFLERQSKIDLGLKLFYEVEKEKQEIEIEKKKIIKQTEYEADKILKIAHEKSKIFIEDKKKDAIIEYENIIKKAQEVIKNDKEKMLDELKTDIIKIAINISEQFLEKNLSEKDKNIFFEHSIATLQVLKNNE